MNYSFLIPLMIVVFVNSINCYLWNKYRWNKDWWDGNNLRNLRQYNGTPARISDFPYIVSIVLVNEGRFHCAGTIIKVPPEYDSKKHGFVLTSGSCINKLKKGGYNYNDVVIRSNSEYWSRCDCNTLMTEYEIHAWRLHPLYNETGSLGHYDTLVSFHDIAIIAIKGRWRGVYDRKANIVPSSSFIQNLKRSKLAQYTSAGWGVKENLTEYPLLELQLGENLAEILPDTCRHMYQWKKDFPTDVLCLTPGPCRFDQGGPVLVRDERRKVHLAAIVSSTPRCHPDYGPIGDPNFPPIAVIPAKNLKFIYGFANSVSNGIDPRSEETNDDDIYE